MDKINVYEYSGIVCPGVVFLLGLGWLFPDHIDLDLVKEVTIGAFALFVIVSFCAGNLVQAVANILEDVFWSPHKYTKKVFKEKNITVSPKEVYALINTKGNINRVDVFNKQYGFMRGLFVGFLVLACISAVLCNWTSCSSFVFLAVLSGYRAFRFASYYTAELITQWNVIKINANEKEGTL